MRTVVLVHFVLASQFKYVRALERKSGCAQCSQSHLSPCLFPCIIPGLLFVHQWLRMRGICEISYIKIANCERLYVCDEWSSRLEAPRPLLYKMEGLLMKTDEVCVWRLSRQTRGCISKESHHCFETSTHYESVLWPQNCGKAVTFDEGLKSNLCANVRRWKL